jgi:cysteinyl-tRNA synthetase
MSKSLKNFITIRQYFNDQLSLYPADDFRIFCLQYNYDSNITYSPDRIQEAATIREKITQFLSRAENISDLSSIRNAYQHINPAISKDRSKELTKQLKDTEHFVREDLANNFNTPMALSKIINLISTANVYVDHVLNDQTQYLPIEPIASVSRYVMSILSVFGLQFPNQINHKSSLLTPDHNREDFDKLLQILIAERASIRDLAIGKMKEMKSSPMESSSDLKKLCSDMLKITDTTRDEVQMKISIKLDDSKSKTLIKR